MHQTVSYQSYTLSSGLRIVHLPMAGNVSYCGFFVDAGTRDEAPYQWGMAHFVEHMLFKGTRKRRAYHIINRMENVGGELNAYTNKEETVIYSIFLEEHIGRAVELLCDLVFGSQFPSHEIDKEREVVIDEIHSYDDSPSELIYDEFENLVFQDSQIGHNILGTPQSLSTFDADGIRRFVNQYYRTGRMVFFSAGNSKADKIIRLLEKYLPETIASQDNAIPDRIMPPLVPPPAHYSSKRYGTGSCADRRKELFDVRPRLQNPLVAQ